MEKFFDYVFMEDYYDWEFPPPIGHFVVVILAIIGIAIACHGSDEKKDEVKHIDMTIEVDTTAYPAVEVNTDSINETDIKDFVVPKTKHWSAQDTKLPIGIVYAMDFAHGTKEKPGNDYGNNYVTVKGLDGKLVITKDIDDDLFLNMQVGDTIR